MKINNDEVLLNSVETFLIGSLMQGVLQGMNQRIDDGGYLSKEERKVSAMMRELVEQLEDADII